ncbi:PMM-domain-containing protein [Aspergillus aculeatinus CBS 121060]|uniref:PMM-domain-containing protein n=1 Tax=Aspergillus aculeatinus CBS 121060 TaxID=1448322 RepID=A0ACD1HH17_9EURO|nr:PMM-domain-containing protein [Aspergillus aculeatinus CBS 121060]RAH72699.1 PMM-domain-containing protein [Aspergillus aculeatinus CBS 121060]
MARQRDLYKVLGVSPKATQQEIRNAYKRESLKSHPDRVPADSPERPARTRRFQEINDAYYTLSDISRRRDYDATRLADGVDEEYDIPQGGAGGFPWSAFGFGSATDREQRASEQFGSVFEEMLREEGLASEDTDADGRTQTRPTSRFWSIVGGISGGALGFIIGNAPGALAGAVAGNRLGAVRDAKGKSVYEVFLELPQTDRARLLTLMPELVPAITSPLHRMRPSPPEFDHFRRLVALEWLLKVSLSSPRFSHKVHKQDLLIVFGIMAEGASVYPSLPNRPLQGTICLFDVDNTLSLPRRGATPEMLELLSRLRHKCAIGYVGGSDFAKQQEQLGSATTNVTSLFDFCFPENGLTAFRLGQPLAGTSFIEWIGEERYQELVNFCLKYIADLKIPKKRGTFIEFRNGMINVSPIGRNASFDERNEFQAYDDVHHIRRDLVEALKKKFPDWGLTYSIGGQISFDVFPTGWDKTYCLKHVAAEKEISGVDYKTIHFFGDKCFEGGNDYEIYSDSRTIGHAVQNPDDTMKLLKELFEL